MINIITILEFICLFEDEHKSVSKGENELKSNHSLSVMQNPNNNNTGASEYGELEIQKLMGRALALRTDGPVFDLRPNETYSGLLIRLSI